MKAKVVVCFEPPAGVLEAAHAAFDIIGQAGDWPMLPSRAIELAQTHQARALLVSGGQAMRADEAKRMPACVKVVATSGVGYDHVDVAAFAARGILTTNTPDVLTFATADFTLLLILAAARRLRQSTEVIDSGWGKKLGQGEMLGLDLHGKRLGILGMGRIGQAVAQRARAFGMEVLYCNRKRLPAEQEVGARYFDTLHAMLPNCHVLSLHAPHNATTTGIIGAREFALLPPDSILVNAARGDLVDENALFAALDSHHLFAAGLDVCRQEPHVDPRFLGHPKVLLTPHVASATRETRHAMGLRALANIQAALSGERPHDTLQA